MGEKGEPTMFVKTSGLCLVHLINYLGRCTSYDKWVKAYCGTDLKSHMPYEWFDSPDKLDFQGLPDYPAWSLRLKGKFILKLSEWRECKKAFKEKGLHTFADWLRYYNNLDVGPALEALEKMRTFYTAKGIDILKEAVDLPGMSLHYLLRGTIERSAELYSPSKEAYKMLKEAVVGGQSLVFTGYHEADVMLM